MVVLRAQRLRVQSMDQVITRGTRYSIRNADMTDDSQQPLKAFAAPTSHTKWTLAHTPALRLYICCAHKLPPNRGEKKGRHCDHRFASVHVHWTKTLSASMFRKSGGKHAAHRASRNKGRRILPASLLPASHLHLCETKGFHTTAGLGHKTWGDAGTTHCACHAGCFQDDSPL